MISRRVALIGHGAMGRRHSRVLRGMPERYTLGGILDPDPATHAALLRVYASEDEAIDDAELVFVASPIAAHSATVLRALEKGRDVFVEKPIGGTRAEAEAMADAARASGRRLFVGHSERFNPVVLALAECVSPESIRAISLRRVGSSRARGRDVLLNLGVHDFDLAAHLTSAPALPRAATGHEESADLLLTARAGCPVRMHVAREGERERSIVLETDDSVYHGDLLRFRLSVVSKHDANRIELPLGSEEPLVLQARAVAQSLDGDASAIATGDEGAMAVVAAEKSLALFQPALDKLRAASRHRPKGVFKPEARSL